MNPPEAVINLNIRNGCMINAISYYDTLTSFDGSQAVQANNMLAKNPSRWVRLLVVEFIDDNQRKEDHALVFFEFTGDTWVYDSMYGSWKVFVGFDAARQAIDYAKAWRPSYNVTSATFVDNQGAPCPSNCSGNNVVPKEPQDVDTLA